MVPRAARRRRRRNHPGVELRANATPLAGDVRERRRVRRGIVGAGRAAGRSPLGLVTPTGAGQQEETPWAGPSSSGSPPRPSSAPTTGRIAVSPDGETVAFSGAAAATGRSSLQELDGDGPARVGASRRPLLAARCSRPTAATCTSPRTTAGSECFDFYRYDLASGALENLLPDTPDFSPLPDFQLSPDGTRIALTRLVTAPATRWRSCPPRCLPGGAAMQHLADHPYTEAHRSGRRTADRLAVAAGTRGQDTARLRDRRRRAARAAVARRLRRVLRRASRAGRPTAAASPSRGGPASTRRSASTSVAGGAVTWAWEGATTRTIPRGRRTAARSPSCVDDEAETGLVHLDLRTRDAERPQRRPRQPLPSELHAGRLGGPRASSAAPTDPQRPLPRRDGGRRRDEDHRLTSGGARRPRLRSTA